MPHSTIKRDDTRLDQIAVDLHKGIEPKHGDMLFMVDLCLSFRNIFHIQGKELRKALEKINRLEGKSESGF